jgi:hypothetical protein
MTETKPLDALLATGVDPTGNDLADVLPKGEVVYTLTSDEWGVVKQANEVSVAQALHDLDLEAYQVRIHLVNTLVDAFLNTSDPRFTDDEATDPKPDQDVKVTLDVPTYLSLFSAVHATWHYAHSGEMGFENEDTKDEAIAQIDSAHARMLPLIQPYTDHFNHDSDGNDLK